MQDVTISLDDDILRLAEAKAQKAGKSLSDYIVGLLARGIQAQPPTDEDKPTAQQEALRRILEGPMWDVTENGRMPTSEERNARR